MKIKLYNGMEAVEACTKAKNSFLYQPGWCMKSFYEEVIFDLDEFPEFVKEDTFISIAYDDDNTPIGACLLFKSLISVFIRPSFRKTGIGKKLVKAITDSSSQNIVAGYGVSGSEVFWRSCGVECTDSWEYSRNKYVLKINNEKESKNESCNC